MLPHTTQPHPTDMRLPDHVAQRRSRPRSCLVTPIVYVTAHEVKPEIAPTCDQNKVSVGNKKQTGDGHLKHGLSALALPMGHSIRKFCPHRPDELQG